MTIPLLAEESTEQFLSGGGEMGKLIRSMDWSKTALGPISEWPQSLRTSVSLCLSSTFPILIAWGPETIQIYNDSYRPICGAKHPQSMGENFRICWETALPVVGDKFTRGQQGEGTYITDQQMFLDRYGYLEESFMTFSFAPIRDESGEVGGIFHPITETTEKMLSGRRTQVLRDLGAALGKSKTIEEMGAETLAQYPSLEMDIPFLAFYQLDGQRAQLVQAVGLAEDSLLAPKTLDGDAVWPIEACLESNDALVVNQLKERFGNFESGPFKEAPHQALLLQIRIAGQEQPFGVLVAGVSARRALDQAYTSFFEQLAASYSTAVSNIYAYEQEQKRAEALAAIDRSKTAFFSNVSHEFRTPLTLMLGPLEELLQKKDLPSDIQTHIDATHRNAIRLLKLVNNLLDFSRVEAGRVQAKYQAVQLDEYTADLASSFRSIIEKANMELIVDCHLNEVVYVDKQMWEKIVLNLLSNAFKYTLAGRIVVKLYDDGDGVKFQVKDTGVGIPEKELPHMFERFHRVANSAGRTHEGTGIGLSLVHELVQLHHGNIEVESIENHGSTFTVSIPKGKSHLDGDLISETLDVSDSSAVKGAFIQEAYSLLEGSKTETNVNNQLQDQSLDLSTRILIVDDNADMRDYLKRLLEPYFSVTTANNGKEALVQTQRDIPTLIISDIMMPVMDGKELLEKLRSNTTTSNIPVIFLSARAGEEARIDGLAAGADDYLVKPFAAAELLAKVQAQIKIQQTRGKAESQLRNLLKQAPVAIALYRGANHIVELANEKMLSYWGLTIDEVLDRPVFDVKPELDEQGFKSIMDGVFSTGESFVSLSVPALLERYGQKDKIYLDLNIEPWLDEKGNIIGTITIAAEVTAHANTQKELENVNDQFDLALTASNIGVWRVDLENNMLILDHRAKQIFGLAAEQYPTAELFNNAVVVERLAELKSAIDAAITSQSRFSEYCKIQPLDGSKPRWINVSGMVQMGDLHYQRRFVGTILDITENRENDIRKNDFIGMVSHELKTPLTSLTGYTQLGLRSATKLQDQSNILVYQRMVDQLQKMNKLINGFLNVAQLESGKITLNTSRFDIAVLLAEIINDLDTVSGSKQFIADVPPFELTADREKIGTVMINLLTNAVKYGHHDTPVEISSFTEQGCFGLAVKNYGTGIASADLSKLFERFYRIDNEQTRSVSGFGIGLYLCAEIIKIHQGKIWAESELGQPTVFKFTLPA